jgi:hypothetical protein
MQIATIDTFLLTCIHSNLKHVSLLSGERHLQFTHMYICGKRQRASVPFPMFPIFTYHVTFPYISPNSLHWLLEFKEAFQGFRWGIVERRGFRDIYAPFCSLETLPVSVLSLFSPYFSTHSCIYGIWSGWICRILPRTSGVFRLRLDFCF